MASPPVIPYIPPADYQELWRRVQDLQLGQSRQPQQAAPDEPIVLVTFATEVQPSSWDGSDLTISSGLATVYELSTNVGLKLTTDANRGMLDVGNLSIVSPLLATSPGESNFYIAYRRFDRWWAAPGGGTVEQKRRHLLKATTGAVIPVGGSGLISVEGGTATGYWEHAHGGNNLALGDQVWVQLRDGSDDQYDIIVAPYCCEGPPHPCDGLCDDVGGSLAGNLQNQVSGVTSTKGGADWADIIAWFNSLHVLVQPTSEILPPYSDNTCVRFIEYTNPTFVARVYTGLSTVGLTINHDCHLDVRWEDGSGQLFTRNWRKIHAGDPDKADCNTANWVPTDPGNHPNYDDGFRDANFAAFDAQLLGEAP